MNWKEPDELNTNRQFESKRIEIESPKTQPTLGNSSKHVDSLFAPDPQGVERFTFRFTLPQLPRFTFRFTLKLSGRAPDCSIHFSTLKLPGRAPDCSIHFFDSPVTLPPSLPGLISHSPPRTTHTHTQSRSPVFQQCIYIVNVIRTYVSMPSTSTLASPVAADPYTVGNPRRECRHRFAN